MKAALLFRFLFLFALILTGVGSASDLPFVFGDGQGNVADYTADQLEQASMNSEDLAGVPQVSSPSDDEVLDFQVTGGGDAPPSSKEKRVGDLKEEFDARVEPDNQRVNDEAVVLALKYPGDLTIDQIASIYGYLKNGDGERKGWGYVRDPRGIDYLRYANASLKLGDRAKCVGGGDCDDFAILMSALIESVGGTTRIILARNESTGGHAYTEVYLGSLSEQNSQVEGIIAWLRQEYGTDRIYTHIDTDTKDVWLNLDWGADEKGNTHPGGPFYQGDKHIVLCIRDSYKKTSLKLPDSYSVPADVPAEHFYAAENATINEPMNTTEPIYVYENVTMNITEPIYAYENATMNTTEPIYAYENATMNTTEPIYAYENATMNTTEPIYAYENATMNATEPIYEYENATTNATEPSYAYGNMTVASIPSEPYLQYAITNATENVIAPSGLSGQVYEECSRCNLTMGEGLPNWNLYLHQGYVGGEVIASAITNEYGYYSFVGIPDGDYVIELVLPYSWAADSPIRPVTFYDSGYSVNPSEINFAARRIS
ncbi:MAG: hypothetical protein PHQ34_02265 [Methanothrix sp.]|nr:hypothetical protein [Methanothrix sp.]